MGSQAFLVTCAAWESWLSSKGDQSGLRAALEVLRIGHPFTQETVFARYAAMLKKAGWTP